MSNAYRMRWRPALGVLALGATAIGLGIQGASAEKGRVADERDKAAVQPGQAVVAPRSTVQKVDRVGAGTAASSNQPTSPKGYGSGAFEPAPGDVRPLNWQPVGPEDFESFTGQEAGFGQRPDFVEADGKGGIAAGTTGACCFAGPCSCLGNQTMAACTGAGGSYQGDKSTCANDICGCLTRACCEPTGLLGAGNDGCIGDQSRAACEAAGNTWHIQASCIGANGSAPDGTGPLPKPKCNRYDINNCVWDNGLPLNDGGASRAHTHSAGGGQLPRYDFSTADDFILRGPDSIPCEVNLVSWYMRARPADSTGPIFNPPNPAADLIGVNLTVYENWVDPNTGRNGPNGYGLVPADADDLNPKVPFEAGGIVYARTFCTGTTLTAPGFNCPGTLGLVNFTLLGGPGGPFCDPPPAVGFETDAVYRVDLTVNPPMLLNKNKKYWIDIEGLFPFNDGLRDTLQTWWMESANNTGFKAMTHRTGNPDYIVTPADTNPPIFPEWWVPINEDLVSPFTTPPQRGNAGNTVGAGPTACAGVAANTRVDFAFRINAVKDAGASNDLCANATEVFSGATSFTNVGATDDAPDTSCANSGADIWFRHTTTCLGVLSVSTCGADFDTIVEVYTGCGGSSLGCSNDDCDGDDANAQIPVIENAQIRIRVAGLNGATGKGSLVLSCDPVCGVDDLDLLVNNCCVDRSLDPVPTNLGCELSTCCEDVCNTPNQDVCCSDLAIGWDAECVANAEAYPSCQCPCTFGSCPNSAGPDFVEAETCGGNTNGGCNNLPNPETFESLGSISAGGAVSGCGTLQAAGGTRDTDWWRLTVNASGMPLTSLSIVAKGEAPIWLFVDGRLEPADIGAGETYCSDKVCTGGSTCEAAAACTEDADCPGGETCEAVGTTLLQFGTIATASCEPTDGSPNCDPLEVCVPDGADYLIIVTSGAATNDCDLEGDGIFSGVTCGAQDQYSFIITATDGCPDGACCLCNGMCDDTLNAYECFLAGGRDWNETTCAGNMCASLAHGCANPELIACNTTTIVDLSNPALEVPPEEGYPCEAAAGDRPDRKWLSFVAPCVDDDGSPGANDCNDEPGPDHTSVRLDTCLGMPTTGRDSLIAIFGSCCTGGTCESGAQCDATTFCGAECCDVDNPLRSSGCGDDECGFTDFLSDTCDTDLIEGETYLIQISNWSIDVTGGVFSLRLACPCVGSCCDQATGICMNNIASDNCQPPLDFSTEFTCETLPQVCGVGACCHANGSCTTTTLPNCLAPGDNHNPNTVCSDIVCAVENSCDFSTGDPTSSLDQAPFGFRSQYAADIDLFLEMADQFEMKGSDNLCEIHSILYSAFHTSHDTFNDCLQGGAGAGCADNPSEYEGIILTISTDIDGDDKAPDCSPTCTTTDCSGGPTYHDGAGCVHEVRFNAPIGKGDPPPPGNYWDYLINVEGQAEFYITLHFDPPLEIEKNKKHWLAITHVVPEVSRYSVIWFASNNYNGNDAQVWNAQGAQEWTPVVGTPNDMLFTITGNKQDVGCGSCQLHGDVVPGACLVDVDDLLCILDAFVLFPADPPDPCSQAAADIEGNIDLCIPDATVDSTDILGVLGAFVGQSNCPPTCSPGACVGDFGSGVECRDETFFPGGMSFSDCNAVGGCYCGDGSTCGGGASCNGTDGGVNCSNSPACSCP